MIPRRGAALAVDRRGIHRTYLLYFVCQVAACGFRASPHVPAIACVGIAPCHPSSSSRPAICSICSGALGGAHPRGTGPHRGQQVCHAAPPTRGQPDRGAAVARPPDALGWAMATPATDILTTGVHPHGAGPAAGPGVPHAGRSDRAAAARRGCVPPLVPPGPACRRVERRADPVLRPGRRAWAHHRPVLGHDAQGHAAARTDRPAGATPIRRRPTISWARGEPLVPALSVLAGSGT